MRSAYILAALALLAIVVIAVVAARAGARVAVPATAPGGGRSPGGALYAWVPDPPLAR